MTPLLRCCFFLSGAAALALEMLWMRSAALLLGQTPATTATVLAVYFAALGLGAAAARRIRRHALRAYACLELGAAAGAVWSVLVFAALHSDALQVALARTGAAGGLFAVALAIAPAALCFGATLPALGEAAADRGRLGTDGGSLYALNTLGGAVGCALVGFGAPLLLGVRATYAAVASASALAGMAALLAAPRPPRPERQQPRRAIGSLSRWRLRSIAAGAGALGLAMEVLWTRLFAQVLHNSVYSFTAVALVFLLALAGGAVLGAWAVQRVDAARLASGALLGAAVAAIGGCWLFVGWTDGLRYVGMHTGLTEYVVRVVALAGATAGPVALASGAVLPALWALWEGDRDPARPLGDLAAANTFGTVAGALGTGFAALPLIGMRAALLLVAIGYVILADLAAPPTHRRVAGYAVLIWLALANPMRLPLIRLDAAHDALRATYEGPAGIVTVAETDGDLQLRLDNYYVLGGSAAATNERRLGLVPLLLHPAPQRVAFIGLATGITASAGAALEVPEISAVELVPEVAAAAREFFAPWNAGVLDRPNVRLVVGDGRRQLAALGDRFDVIVSDLFVPWHAAAGSLYSREMYELVARRLAPGGLFCQWLPLYQLTREEFDTIAHTLLDVFPNATLWRADFYPDRPVLGIVAQLAPQPLDLASIDRRLRALPAWSRDGLLTSPSALAMLYLGDLRAAAELVDAAPLNTDDRPHIEFTAPRLTRLNAAGDNDWFIGDSLAAFADAVAARDGPSSAAPLPATAELAAARRAGIALYRYALAASSHDDAGAAAYEAEVRTLVPDVIAAADAVEVQSNLASARRQLLGLEREQDEVRRRLADVERQLGALHEEPGDPE